MKIGLLFTLQSGHTEYLSIQSLWVYLNSFSPFNGVGEKDEGRDDGEGHDGTGAQQLGVHLLRVDNVFNVKLHVGGSKEDLNSNGQ